MTDAILEQMNNFSRMLVCGQISAYNKDKPDTGAYRGIMYTVGPLYKGHIKPTYSSVKRPSTLKSRNILTVQTIYSVSPKLSYVGR